MFYIYIIEPCLIYSFTLGMRSLIVLEITMFLNILYIILLNSV